MIDIDEYCTYYTDEKDLLHREDGPAKEYFNGHSEWWFHGERFHVKTNSEFLQLMKMKAFW